MPKWTVMVFMGAEGVEGNASLEKEADADIAELQAVPPSENLTIWVERHGVGKAERFRLHAGGKESGGAQPEAAPEAFANGQALMAFIDQATKPIGLEPDHYTMLVLWGHAYRFAFGHTGTQFGIDALDFAELADVFRAFQRHKREQLEQIGAKLTSDPKLDIVAFDACSLATIETACQLAPFADFLIASQVGVPLPGWPYQAILTRLADPKDRVMGPAELGSYAVRRYCEYYRATERAVTLSHLNLRHADELMRLTEGLARALAVCMDDDPQEIPKVAQMFREVQTGPDEPFIDVLNLCAQLVRNGGSDELRAAALALGDHLLSPTGEGPKASAKGLFQPFIVEHGRNSCECAGLHGVSLYAPNVAADHDAGSAAFFYDKFVFASKTVWRDLVRALALPS